MNWETKLLVSLRRKVTTNQYWKSKLRNLDKSTSATIHLAIFSEPFLNLILNGIKTIESRFSKNKISPFNKIKSGDIIILKKSGGSIKAICEARQIYFYSKINRVILKDIDTKYGKKIASKFERNFWGKREKTNYGTLIELGKVELINNLSCEKKDRRGWVTLENNKLP